MKKYDIIIVVPISKKRQKERGYNQSELIAKEISKMLSIKIEKNIIKKLKNTPPQSSLNKEQRQENIRGVYKVFNIEKIENKNILIIDDIYTTGSTVNECSKMLRKAQPRKVDVLVLAKD